jgi:predicted TIM-barrel fold metal-dependent hydrolase
MVSERALIVSSDGHATAQMNDWAPYLPERSRADFKDFCELYNEIGSRNWEPRALSVRLDADVIEDWKTRFIDSGRLDGNSDPAKRLAQMDSEGVTAEVLFPDFGLPFEMLGPTASGAAGRQDLRTQEQMNDSNTAFNRWLAEFCSVSPDRWAGMAKVSFDDVDAVMAEIKWAKEAGLRGIVLPHFDDEVPVYHARFDPIWSLLEDLDLPVNCHPGISSITRRRPTMPKAAHPACAIPLLNREINFVTQQLLIHMIWGGVLERHPRLRVVFTEVGTAWAAPTLRGMDHTFEGSYLRRDIRDVIKVLPSEYFSRQCFMGSSIFSLAEVEARNDIGVDKMMLGMDFPHHEGTLFGAAGTADYLQATLGSAGVPITEARVMLGESAANVFHFDIELLRDRSHLIGPELDTLLSPPTVDKYDRGDVHKPLMFV